MFDDRIVGSFFSLDHKFVISAGPVFHANRDITLRPGNLDSDWLQTCRIHELVQSKVGSGNPECIRTRIPRYYNTIDDTVGLRRSIDSFYQAIDPSLRFGTFFSPLIDWQVTIDNENVGTDAVSWRESYDCITYLQKQGFSMKKPVELYFGVLFEDKRQWEFMQERMKARGYSITTAYDSTYSRPYLLNVSKFYSPNMKPIHDAVSEIRTELRTSNLYTGVLYTGIGVRGEPH